MKKYSHKVIYILKTHPESREDDRVLYQFYLIYTHGKGSIIDKKYINIDVISQCPNMDTLGRIRRKLQNENGLFLSTKQKKKQRAEREQNIKKEISK